MIDNKYSKSQSSFPPKTFSKDKSNFKKVNFSTPVQFVKGVGPKLSEILNKNGIKTIADFIENFPRTYEDRRSGLKIMDLKVGQLVSFKAQISKVQAISLGKTHRKIYDIILKDSSGVIHCKFFRVPYKGYFERFQPMQEIRVVGKVIEYRGKVEIHHPDLRDIDPEEELLDELIPVYVEMEGVSSFKWQKIINQVLDVLAADKDLYQYDKLPQNLRKKLNLMGYLESLKQIHQPPISQFKEFLEKQSAAHKRFIFEEFFLLELFLASKKMGLKKEKSFKYNPINELTKKIKINLPFKLTLGQEVALKEIENDYLTEYPMHRLVQGDVGCGKTLVAFIAAAMVFDNNKQACMMVPTEILAEQHFVSAEKYLSATGIKIGLLTGKTKNSERTLLFDKLLKGEINFLIGTHALIEDDVVFHDLGLVIIDEQHRFGVNQRTKLKMKGRNPHFLIMTATPIPRTLAMTAFGDLDISIINELPPGRSPIQTRAIYQNKRPNALDFMKEQIAKGRQAYIVFPLVEESEKIDLKNATDEFEILKKLYPDIRFGLLHGKMKSVEKDEIMDQFRNHQFDVLVSTTVIEVGVDIPNANMIIIEHAERFGLSQLHQLRGRVGRGQHKSFCILIMGYAVSEESKERIVFMETTNDGFKLAEFDLELRGPGEFLGTKQSGVIGFKLADLIKNQDLLLLARQEAFEVLANDPELKRTENIFLNQYLKAKKDADLG